MPSAAAFEVKPMAGLALAAQRDNWKWRHGWIGKLKNVLVGAELTAIASRMDAIDYRTANRRVSSLAQRLRASNIHRAFDEQKIRDFAENHARLCGRLPTLEERESFATYAGVEPPQGRAVTKQGALARLADPLWWRRQVRKVWTRSSEDGERAIGMVRKGRAPYASDDAVQRRAAQKRRMREWLTNHQAVSDDGATIALEALADGSLANPALRRGELMARSRGFEEIARALGHEAIFVTLTTPSRFHAQLAASGENPNHDGSSVRDGQAWLTKTWARARAKLARAGILTYGFRVAEPHHDGTPHWHFLLFARPDGLDRGGVSALLAVLLRYALKDSGDEPGAREKRCVAERVDTAKGCPTGYLSKYISKNVDGAGAIKNERSDEDDSRPINTERGGTVERVEAWASTHGIRQFAQIGGPTVSLYREARRLRHRVDDPDIEGARILADSGRCGGFITWIGGIACGRRTNLRLERIERGKLNRYGEARPSEIIGLRWASAVAITRPCQWRIERKPCSSASLFSALGPVAITVRGASGYNEPAGWTNPQETSQAGPER
jgi:hypothetical protein